MSGVDLIPTFRVGLSKRIREELILLECVREVQCTFVSIFQVEGVGKVLMLAFQPPSVRIFQTHSTLKMEKNVHCTFRTPSKRMNSENDILLHAFPEKFT